MKTWITAAALAAVILLGGCQTAPEPVTISATPGPAAAKLDAAVQDQIKLLQEQIAALRQQNLELQKLNASAAGSVHGVQMAAPHIVAPEDQNAKDAILAEAELARQALELNKDAPPEVVAAYAKKALEAEERVNAFLTGERDKALAKVAEANRDVDAQKQVVSAKDAEIQKRDQALKDKDGEIAKLKADAAEELKREQGRLQGIIDARDKTIHDLQDAEQKKQRSLWVNGIRIVCLGFIVIGVLAIALTEGRMIFEGAIMAGCGVAGIFVAMGFDILVHQPWFPYAFGTVVLIALVACGVWLYRMFKAHQLAVKATAVFDDIKTEAQVKGSQLWKEVQEHTDFRGITDVITKQAAKLGLDEKPGRKFDLSDPAATPPAAPAA